MERYNAMQNVLNQPNSHAMGVMKLLNDYYPALAKKVFEGNPLMQAMIMSNYSSMDILVHPMCGHCESLALYCGSVVNPDGTIPRNEYGKTIKICRCRKCGKETVNPITFYEWCLMELKKRAPEDIGIELTFAVDIMAKRAMEDAKRLLYRAQEKEKYYVESEEP